jgi:hypothetical protein
VPLSDFLQVQAGCVLLAVKVQPRASKNEIGTPQGPELKVYVTAPPVDAAANEVLIRLLAETLVVERIKLRLCAGKSRAIRF